MLAVMDNQLIDNRIPKLLVKLLKQSLALFHHLEGLLKLGAFRVALHDLTVNLVKLGLYAVMALNERAITFPYSL